MSESPAYTEYHPRWFRPRVSTYWWLGRWPYVAFILRELSSIFVAWFVVYLLLLVRAVGEGEAAYRQFLAWSGRPLVLLVNVVGVSFVVFHAITWFNLSSQALVLHLRGKRLPGVLITASNYLVWVVASALVVWLVLGR
jgi:fumarate reductase subunit C